MKLVRLTLITLAVYLAQTTFIKYFAVGGIIPNMPAVMAMCCALTESDYTKAVVYGALVGAALDFSAETIFGLHTLLCIFASAACMLASEKFFKGKIPVSVLIVFAISFIYEILYCAMSFALYQNIDKTNAALGIALPGAIYNAALSVPALFMMRHMKNTEE